MAVLQEYEGSHPELQTKTPEAGDDDSGPKTLYGPDIFRPSWPDPQ